MQILALHSSRFGHTSRILHRVAAGLELAGAQVEIRPASVVRNLDPAVDAVILAGSVRYGFYSPQLKRFARQHAVRLNQLTTAFLGVSLSAMTPGKTTAQSNPYTRKFLASTPWQPTVVRLFGGEINFDMYRGLDRWMLGMILERTGKPHGPGVRVDYTDWAEVDAFAADFAKLVENRQLGSDCPTQTVR